MSSISLTLLFAVGAVLLVGFGVYLLVWGDRRGRTAQAAPVPFRDDATPGIVHISNSSINIFYGPPEEDEDFDLGFRPDKDPFAFAPSNPLEDLYEGNLKDEEVRRVLSDLIDGGMSFTYRGRTLSKEDIPNLDVSSLFGEHPKSAPVPSEEVPFPSDPPFAPDDWNSRDGGQSEEMPYEEPGRPAGADYDAPENHTVDTSEDKSHSNPFAERDSDRRMKELADMIGQIAQKQD